MTAEDASRPLRAPLSAGDGPVGQRRRSPLLRPLVYLVVCLVLFPTFTVVYVAWAEGQNNHKFCATLGAITAPRPPQPSIANPSRSYENSLYDSVTNLERRLGC